jgi:hypothetical protein
MAEYGSARAAALRFCRDADAAQVDDLRREWKKFRSQHTSLRHINAALQRLGAAWQFGTLDEFDRLLDGD